MNIEVQEKTQLKREETEKGKNGGEETVTKDNNRRGQPGTTMTGWTQMWEKVDHEKTLFPLGTLSTVNVRWLV